MRIYLNRQGIYTRQTVLFSRDGCSRPARCCAFIRGKHPVYGEPLFCLSANPDSLSELCGFHIDHRSRSFLLQVSGISSHLSFCCTSLVSGFIIHAGAPFVHSQTIQRNRQNFVETLKTTGKIQQKRSVDRRFCALCPTLDPSCGKPLLQLLAAGPIACGVFRRNA